MGCWASRDAGPSGSPPLRLSVSIPSWPATCSPRTTPQGSGHQQEQAEGDVCGRALRAQRVDEDLSGGLGRGRQADVVGERDGGKRAGADDDRMKKFHCHVLRIGSGHAGSEGEQVATGVKPARHGSRGLGQRIGLGQQRSAGLVPACERFAEDAGQNREGRSVAGRH